MAYDPRSAFDRFLNSSLDELLAPGEASDGLPEALVLLRRVADGVPAYGAMLKAAGLNVADIHDATDFARLPLLNKENYVRRFPLEALVEGGDLAACDFFAVSSGSTGEPTLWPRGLHHEFPVAVRFEQVLRDSFRAHERRTLAVVCFALGSWVGGMYTTSCLRWVATKGYPLLIVTPGNKIDEILRVVRRLAPDFEQTVLLGYPPFLKEVVDAGRGEKVDWGQFNVRLVTAGEVFSETWRDLVLERLEQDEGLNSIASLYGTADAGVLGNETPLSVAIRRFLSEKPEAAKALFGEERLPTLCQYDPTSRYFEVVEGGTLAFSGDNGAPLIRYHIADQGGIYSFEAMRAKLADYHFDAETAVMQAGFGHPRRLPFVYVFGRANFTVSFFGANIFPETISLALEKPSLSRWTTGKFVMEVKEGLADRPRFTVAIELADKETADPTRIELAEREILETLLGHNSEYANYVSKEDQRPVVTLWSKGHSDYFPVGVKHRYSRR
ncbi:phenylacetate--CoA ligase family protein [Dongia deserti]|uniref:phenylacetate--CoA ligase family protein n=1 Tax=Dongia deserti TaxID=2268030 RepID=UPI000E65182C|nr:phenylacetate--CoA ligase family protein [Dongia deserti]